MTVEAPAGRVSNHLCLKSAVWFDCLNSIVSTIANVQLLLFILAIFAKVFAKSAMCTKIAVLFHPSQFAFKFPAARC